MTDLHHSSDSELDAALNFIIPVIHNDAPKLLVESVASAKAALLRWRDRAVEEASIKSEIKGKIWALDKIIMGAGEYHDDPYEYVVRLSDLHAYRAEFARLDLTQPIFRDKGPR